jgi:hypothetical protein
MFFVLLWSWLALRLRMGLLLRPGLWLGLGARLLLRPVLRLWSRLGPYLRLWLRGSQVGLRPRLRLRGRPYLRIPLRGTVSRLNLWRNRLCRPDGLSGLGRTIGA